MQKRHSDRSQYFREQGITTKKYVIPYIEKTIEISSLSRVLEVGCGEGGNMAPFLDLGCEVMGVDLNERSIDKANQFFSNHSNVQRLSLISENIYDCTIDQIGKFDVIFLRDVIEHIPNQEKFIPWLKFFLNDGGVIFFGFPPWQMPFGGHQQIIPHKVLSKLPYTHLLPNVLYVGLMKVFGVPQNVIDTRLVIKETGISIERFEKILKKSKYNILKKTHYLVNPNYQIKFGLTPRKQFPVLRDIPFLRNFYTTCAYYIIRPL